MDKAIVVGAVQTNPTGDPGDFQDSQVLAVDEQSLQRDGRDGCIVEVGDLQIRAVVGCNFYGSVSDFFTAAVHARVSWKYGGHARSSARTAGSASSAREDETGYRQTDCLRILQSQITQGD